MFVEKTKLLEENSKEVGGLGGREGEEDAAEEPSVELIPIGQAEVLVYAKKGARLLPSSLLPVIAPATLLPLPLLLIRLRGLRRAEQVAVAAAGNRGRGRRKERG